MTKENKSLKVKTSSRRKFFKTAAKASAVAAAAVAMPSIATAGGHKTLKMQLDFYHTNMQSPSDPYQLHQNLLLVRFLKSLRLLQLVEDLS